MSVHLFKILFNQSKSIFQTKFYTNLSQTLIFKPLFVSRSFGLFSPIRSNLLSSQILYIHTRKQFSKSSLCSSLDSITFTMGEEEETFDREAHLEKYTSKYTMPVIDIEESTERQPYNLTLKHVVERLERIAPLSLAEPWDNVGLLLEPYDTKKVIKRIMLTVDLTDEVLNEAVENKTDLIIAYHPPLFVAVKKIHNKHWKQRIISTCLAHNIAIFSPHTSLDAVQGGVNDWLASIYDMVEYTPIVPAEVDKFTNLVAIAHKATDTDVVQHLTEIAKNAFGETYNDSLSIHPVANQSTHVLISDTALSPFLAGLYSASKRYESVSVAKRPLSPSRTSGTGRLVKLRQPIALLKAVKKMKAHINKLVLRIALPQGRREQDIMIGSIAVCAGSGGSVLKGANADLYITGEMSHHDILDATHNGATVLLLEHSDSERTYLEPYRKIIIQKLRNYFDHITVTIASKDQEPIGYI